MEPGVVPGILGPHEKVTHWAPPPKATLKRIFLFTMMAWLLRALWNCATASSPSQYGGALSTKNYHLSPRPDPKTAGAILSLASRAIEGAIVLSQTVVVRSCHI